MNLEAFEGRIKTANAYPYAILAGGSGAGKTAGGYEIADRLKKLRPKYRVIHCYSLPYGNAWVKNPPESEVQKRSPRDLVIPVI